MDSPSDSLPAPARPEPRSGDILGGRYRLIRALGEGGMGMVFEAENVATLRRAAVKWVHPRFAPHAVAQQRLLREARATSRIRHRNVVDLYDVVLEHDAVVLVMELLTGELLSERLQREKTSLPQLLRWLVAAMEGVAAAHAVGVIHRDIKPANIFLAHSAPSEEPVPKVIDFGISKVNELGASRLTHSGVAMGTPRYMSFEQLRCDPSLDARSDVYAFGVILYEALVGRAPYEGSSFGEQAVAFITRDPALPRTLRPELPEALSALVFRAISRDRELRQANILELVQQLQPFCRESAWPGPLNVWEGPPALPEGAVLGACSTQRASSLPVRPAPRRARRWSPLLALAVGLFAATAFLPWLRAKDGTRSHALTLARTEVAEIHEAQPAPTRAHGPVLEESPAVPAPSAPSADAGVSPIRARHRVQRPSEPIAASAPAPEEAASTPVRNVRTHRAGPVARDEF